MFFVELGYQFNAQFRFGVIFGRIVIVIEYFDFAEIMTPQVDF